jgi:GNAT superfamily N-acetyltransferase
MLGLERDLSFTPMNAAEIYRGLNSGKTYAKGGGVIMKHPKSYYQDLPSYSGYKWVGFDKGKHIFQKKEAKGYSVIEALESDLTNGNIEFMAEHGLTNTNKKATGGGVGEYKLNDNVDFYYGRADEKKVISGTISDILNDGYTISTGFTQVMVKPNEIVGYSKQAKPKKKRFGIFADGGGVNYLIEDEGDDEDRIKISIENIGEAILVISYPKYEFQEDLTEKEFDKIGLEEEEPIGKIEHIQVEDKEKGKGYAKLLMNKVIEVAKERGMFPLYLNASPMGSRGLNIEDLTEFYKSFGFKVFKKQGNNNLMLLEEKNIKLKKYVDGGGIGQENKEMVLNNNKQIAHHTEELSEAVRKSKYVPAWVVAKVNRSATDLSDATHYMEGENETYATGGGVQQPSYAIKLSELLNKYEPTLIGISRGMVQVTPSMAYSGAELSNMFKGFGDSMDIKNIVYRSLRDKESYPIVEKLTKGKYKLIKPTWSDNFEDYYFDNITKKEKGGGTKKEFIAKKVGKVMREFKEGDLHIGTSNKIVKNPKQAIAIALSEGKRGWKHKK